MQGFLEENLGSLPAERERLSADRGRSEWGAGAGILPLRSAHPRLPMPGNLSAVFRSDLETPGLP